ncbi:oligosaccharide repeat unit polymerase [Vibrio cholerae]|uniref:oligosaccharide repeat unit polymerase n=1 Tax=Vibrio cholerae TaxID=666 RepID=UPI003AF86DED
MIKIKSSTYRTLITVFFVVLNSYAFIYMWSTETLIGDVKNNQYKDVGYILLSASLVVSSYLFVWFFFELFNNLKFKRSNLLDDVNQHVGHKIFKTISIILIILQISYFVYLYSYGLKANFSGEVSNPIKYLFIVIPVNYIFMIYYAVYRGRNIGFLYFLSIALALSSALYQGFVGIFNYIFFIEFYIYARRKGVGSKVVFLFFIVLAVFPILHSIKSSLRLGESGDFISFLSLFVGQEGFSILFYLHESIFYLISRLQIVSPMSEFVYYSTIFRDAFFRGDITPFWLEGTHGNIIKNLFNYDIGVNIGYFATTTPIFDSYNPDHKWIANVGLFYWFIIDPLIGCLLLIYSIVIIFLFSFFSKKITNCYSVSNLVFFVLIFFLIPPWIGSLVSFLLSFIIFYFAVYFLKKFYLMRF